MRVRQIGEEYFVPLSHEAMEALHLTDGEEVEVCRVGEATIASAPIIEYLSDEEALQIYRSTEPQHRRAYEELAK